jgi:hypothetical protein
VCAVLEFQFRDFQDFALARKALYHLSHAPALFSGYFHNKVLLFVQAVLDYDPILGFQ